jgi:hypothetical protein
MKGLEFEQVMEKETFRQYLSRPEDMSGRIGRMEKRNRGRITKAGNTPIRKLLTESARHYPRPVKVGKGLAERRSGTNELVIVRADKAMRELHDKYYRMIHEKKNACVAITAVSRQLAGYIWGASKNAKEEISGAFNERRKGARRGRG